MIIEKKLYYAIREIDTKLHCNRNQARKFPKQHFLRKEKVKARLPIFKRNYTKTVYNANHANHY